MQERVQELNDETITLEAFAKDSGAVRIPHDETVKRLENGESVGEALTNGVDGEPVELTQEQLHELLQNMPQVSRNGKFKSQSTGGAGVTRKAFKKAPARGKNKSAKKARRNNRK